MKTLFLLIGLFGSLTASVFAQDSFHDPMQARLLAEPSSFTAGQSFTVALELKHEEGWHSYWREPGEAGLPTEIKWTLPQGVSAGPLLWPQPLTFEDPGDVSGYGYTGTVHLLTEIRVAKSFKAQVLELKAKAFWLVCREVCIPGDAQLTLSLPSGDSRLSSDAPLFQSIRPSLGLDPAPLSRHSQNPFLLMLAFALLGGLLLNLMPCVLPVLSLKVLSFVEQAGESRAEGVRLSAFFTAGVLFSFWALAAAVLFLKSIGSEVGWGFQFQSPWFVLVMAVVVLSFALNLLGVFEITLPGGAMQGLAKASSKQGYAGAFGHGFFMTLLATPCTAPFLGTALGFAFGASALHLVLIFTAVGIGLALPYSVLAAFPGAHAWVPKPGPWMLRFKEAMGWLLIATFVWLAWLLAKQVGTDQAGLAWTWLLIWAIALWVLGWAATAVTPVLRRWIIRGIVLGIIALSGWMLLQGGFKEGPQSQFAAGTIAWDPVKIEELRQKKAAIFVDFTADWCWTCKVNEKGVLESEAVKKSFVQNEVIFMKADWTRRDSAIGAAIKSFGRSGVPLYVVYKGMEKPLVLPEIISVNIVLDALKGKRIGQKE